MLRRVVTLLAILAASLIIVESGTAFGAPPQREVTSRCESALREVRARTLPARPAGESAVAVGRHGVRPMSAADLPISATWWATDYLFPPWRAEVRGVLVNDTAVPLKNLVADGVAYDLVHIGPGQITGAMSSNTVGCRALYPGWWTVFSGEMICNRITAGSPTDVIVWAQGQPETRMPLLLEATCGPVYGADPSLRHYDVTVQNLYAYQLNDVRVAVHEYEDPAGDTYDVGFADIASIAPGATAMVTVDCGGVPAQGAPPVPLPLPAEAFAEGLKAEPASTTVTRIAGADRYSTAVQAVLRAFPAGAGTVVLVSGEGFADALCASALAGAYDAPVLLTKAHGLPATVASAVSALGATRTIVVGGIRAVSPAVELQARSAMPSGSVVERISGSDRYATSAQVCDATAARLGTKTTEAFLVRGDMFADALACGPYAFSQRMPVLLTRASALPSTVASAAARAGVRHVWIAGGSAAVPDAVANTSGIPWTRLGGENRYETVALIAATAHDQAWSDCSTVGLASGEGFADALSAGPVIGRSGGVLLTTARSCLSAESGVCLAVVGDHVSRLDVFGGTAATSDLTKTIAYRLCP